MIFLSRCTYPNLLRACLDKQLVPGKLGCKSTPLAYRTLASCMDPATMHGNFPSAYWPNTIWTRVGQCTVGNSAQHHGPHGQVMHSRPVGCGFTSQLAVHEFFIPTSFYRELWIETCRDKKQLSVFQQVIFCQNTAWNKYPSLVHIICFCWMVT